MKKEYIKPYLAVESFQLNAAIAASCSDEGKIKIGIYLNSCNADEEEPGMSYVGDACTTDIVNPDDDDYFCYHGPLDPNSTFLKS